MTQFSSGCHQVLQGQRQKGPNGVLQTRIRFSEKKLKLRP